MNYDLQEGIVFTRVCGQNLLIATRSAWGKCPYTKTLSALQGAFWQGLTMGLTQDEIVSELMQKTNINETALRKRLAVFIDVLKAEGYMRKEDVNS